VAHHREELTFRGVGLFGLLLRLLRLAFGFVCLGPSLLRAVQCAAQLLVRLLELFEEGLSFFDLLLQLAGKLLKLLRLFPLRSPRRSCSMIFGSSL
jgi:hypothetical protein